MKKKVKIDVQMVREYLNVIILSLGTLILQLNHLLHKLMLYSIIKSRKGHHLLGVHTKLDLNRFH